MPDTRQRSPQEHSPPRTALRYGLGSRKILSETIEDETLVINLETGSYYSLTASGSRAWQLLLGGYSVDELSALCTAENPANRETVCDELQRFVAALCSEGLLSPCGETAPDGREPQVPLPSFSTPTFTKYTDMEALLLADPIHEVAP